MKEFLCGISAEKLQDWCKANNIPGFRSKQILHWLYERFAVSPAEMLNLPQPLREQLTQDFITPGTLLAETLTAPDGVRKLALTLTDNECIEMVIIPAADGRESFCLSTQVGCPVGCIFCASGKHGFTRNLKTGEMIGQFVRGCQLIGGKPDNIVFMGIGEGMLNFDNLAETLSRLTDKEYFDMSPRRITVSTSGYVPGMLKFAELKKEYNLAVSLHAADDETRAKLIPPAVRYSISEVLRAADICRDAHNRQYTIEYTMIDGINCDMAMARKLAALAIKHHAKINLIPFNETDGFCRRPSRDVINQFENEIAAAGARVTRRVERGSKKTAACGQLRSRRIQNDGENQ